MSSTAMDQANDNEEGCSSRRNCSSPEEDGERPLKKARYLWQIKGKHHLKDKDLSKLKSDSSEDVSMEMDICDANESRENNVPQDVSGTVVTHNVAVAAELEQVSSCVKSPSEGTSMSGELLPDIFPKVNKAINRTSYLQRCWQTKQLARGMLDNTMNCMMERMGFAPLTSDHEDSEVAAGGTQLEDEAVMMAIQRHGLQCSEDELHFQQDVNQVAAEENVCKDLSKLLFSGPNNRAQEPLTLETNVHTDISCTEGSTSQIPQAILVPNCPPSVADLDSQSTSQPLALSQMEHDSFLDAAVAVAIQKKGLSVLTGTEIA